MIDKINISVLITSIDQRKITIDTANYYSNICNEVILVDEQQPHLSDDEIKILKKKGIKYIKYKTIKSEFSIDSLYKKRLIAANRSSKRFIVHSNHDERYTYHGLLACISELENNKDLIFCAGQAIAVRKFNNKIYYTRSYKNLIKYKNINEVKLRLYNHSEKYVPIAHYSVWRKKSFIDSIERTISVLESLPSDSILNEVIFEFSADLSGNSKSLNEFYWLRNRIDQSWSSVNIDFQYSIKVIKNKLNLLLGNLNDVKVDILINGICKNLPFLQPKSFIEKIISLIKFIIRKVLNFKKREKRRTNGFDDIENLLNESKIKYNKKDLKNLLNSMNL
tara:strand:+ start:1556 stop:2563 length:1008 start_codon:yes stop_codon:yes gene_type:complete